MFVRQVKAKSDDAAAAVNAALRILTRREYSKLELYTKLSEKFTPEAAKAALKKCIENNWQSEERYAKMLFNHLKSSLYGPLKIAMQMSVKGVRAEYYQADIDETDWAEIGCQYLKKKSCANHKELSYEQKQKLLASLSRRGFSNSQCLDAMKLALSVTDE